MRSGQQPASSHQLGLQAAPEAGEHAAYFAQLVGDSLVLQFWNVAQVAGKQHLIFDFVGRAASHVQEPGKICVAGPSRSFRNVGRNRDRCPPQLSSQSKSLVCRKRVRQHVNSQGQGMCLLPNHKLPLTLPRMNPWDSGSRYASLTRLVSLTQLGGVPCTPPAAT